MVGSKSSRRSSSQSNASSASKSSKGHRRRRQAHSAVPPRLPGPTFAPPCQTAPQAVRSATIWTDPKMRILKKFVRKTEAEPPAPQEHSTQVSITDGAESFGDEEFSRDQQSDLDSLSDCSPMMFGSRRASASSRRASAATNGGYSRRTSAASSRRTSAAADSRRTSAASSASFGHVSFGQGSLPLPKAAAPPSFEGTGGTIGTIGTTGTESRQPSRDRPNRRISFRPASASAVLQRPAESPAGWEPDRDLGLVPVDQRARKLVKEAQQQHKQQVAKAMNLEEQLGEWMAKRDEKKDAAGANPYQSYLNRPSSKNEHLAAEAKRSQMQFFDMRGVRERFLNRAGHSLQKLLVDFELAHHSGGQAQSHQARCKHLDGVYDWYEKHADLKHTGKHAPEETSMSSPWITVKHGEAPPPGSLRRPRSAAAAFSSSSSGRGPMTSLNSSATLAGIPRSVSAPNLSP